MPENTVKIQEKTKFQKGQSGNPYGRPQGARNKASLMAEQLFIDDIQGICESVVSQAKSGNIQAAKIILDRLLPPRKDPPILLELPKIETAEDIVQAIGSITQAVACGAITSSEGEALARIIDIHSRAFELYQYEKRLTKLENL